MAADLGGYISVWDWASGQRIVQLESTPGRDCLGGLQPSGRYHPFERLDRQFRSGMQKQARFLFTKRVSWVL
jgi:hypothetical protein